MLEAKEKKFTTTVFLASRILNLPQVPKVNFWDSTCPYSGMTTDIAHAHPDKNMICINKGRLKSLNMDEIEDVAIHETAHMVQIGHDAAFQKVKNELALGKWYLEHA